MTDRSDLVPCSEKGMVLVKSPAGQQEAQPCFKQGEFNTGDWLHSDIKVEKLNRMLRQGQVSNGKKQLAPSRARARAGGRKKGDSITSWEARSCTAEQKPERACAAGAEPPGEPTGCGCFLGQRVWRKHPGRFLCSPPPRLPPAILAKPT